MPPPFNGPSHQLAHITSERSDKRLNTDAQDRKRITASISDYVLRGNHDSTKYAPIIVRNTDPQYETEANVRTEALKIIAELIEFDFKSGHNALPQYSFALDKYIWAVNKSLREERDSSALMEAITTAEKIIECTGELSPMEQGLKDGFKKNPAAQHPHKLAIDLLIKKYSGNSPSATTSGSQKSIQKPTLHDVKVYAKFEDNTADPSEAWQFTPQELYNKAEAHVLSQSELKDRFKLAVHHDDGQAEQAPVIFHVSQKDAEFTLLQRFNNGSTVFAFVKPTDKENEFLADGAQTPIL